MKTYMAVSVVTVGNFAFLFNCMPMGRTSDSMTVPLSIDEMIGACCFQIGCLSGPPVFTCWIYFAPVFSFIYC